MKPSGTLVPADYLGSVVLADLELQPPRKPRLPPEIVVVPVGPDKILFEGAKRTQVLSGTSSRTLLFSVLEQLDGTRSWEEIAAAVPKASFTDVSTIITLLFSCGLLEDGVSPPPPDELRDLDSFFGRFVDVTRNNRNRGEAMARLYRAPVVTAGSAGAAEMIAVQLSEASAAPRFVDDADGDLAGAPLLIAVATEEREDLAPIIAAARRSGVPALHVRIGRNEVQIGPLFIAGQTACYDCFRALHDLPPGDADPLRAPMWLSLAALQAMHLISRTADVRLGAGFESYENTRHGTIHHLRHVARLPGCPTCGIAGPPIDPDSPAMLAWLYHNSVGMPPREIGSRRVHQRHYLAQNIEETKRPADPYHGATVTPLPSADFANGSGLRLETIAALLRHAAGFQEVEGEPRRIAPTGGGMGSPELFVIVRAMDGLRPGIHHYHAPRHVLEWLYEPAAADISAALGAASWDWPCTIVGAGALRKLHSKYANFAYRLVNLDAGIALHILGDLASRSGLAMAEATDAHDEALAQLIRVPRKDNRYVITFALGVGVATATTRRFTKLGARILDVLVDQSNLAERPAPPAARRAAAPWNAAALLTRRSQRTYAEQAVPRSTIQTLAIAARDAGAPLRQWWLVRLGSRELPPGIYEFDGDDLLRRGAAPELDDLRRCLNQTGLAAAPAILFFTANLAAALRARGARGYRETLLQAGAACASVLLTAESLGVGACPTAGIVEYGFRRITGCDGYHDCPMIGVTLGYSPEE